MHLFKKAFIGKQLKKILIEVLCKVLDVNVKQCEVLSFFAHFVINYIFL